MKTEDVCALDYPPVCYGETLAETESTIQDILENIFRDASGLLLRTRLLIGSMAWVDGMKRPVSHGSTEVLE